MKRRDALSIYLGLLLLPLFAAGCGNKSGSGTASPTPKPSATPTPLPLTVRAQDIQSTILDGAGHTIAQITAERAAVAPSKDSAPSDPIGLVSGASAILYQNNKKTAALKADTLRADRDKGIVVGTGNVTIKSLSQPDSPTIRADTMTWRYKGNSIVGQGNVLITRDPDVQLPGERFTADTALRRFTLFSNGAPATGTF